MGKLTKTKTKGLFRKADGTGWILDKMIEGQRIYLTLEDIPESLAKKILNKLVSEVVESKYFPNKTNCSLTVRDALNRYWEKSLQYTKSAKNAKFLFTPVDSFFGDKVVSSLKHEDVVEYIRLRSSQYTRLGTPTKPRTINYELQILCSSLNFAKKNGSIVNNPISGYEHAKQPKPKKIILDEGYEDGPQWNAIIRNADPGTAPIVTCLYETGMRPAEAFLMQWDWIKVKREDAFLIEIPQHLEKTGAIRTIPVSPKLLEVFNKLPRISKYVFPSPVTGEARKGIQRAFDGILRRAGLNNTELTPYALRRTRITIWDAVDSDCCRYVVGHTPKDVHGRNYREFTSERLFKMVGIEFGKKDLFKLISNVG